MLVAVEVASIMMVEILERLVQVARVVEEMVLALEPVLLEPLIQVVVEVEVVVLMVLAALVALAL
jgi:hypothetical protein